MSGASSRLLSILFTVLPAAALAQAFGGGPVPEPTRLGEVASNPDSSIVLVGSASRVERNDTAIGVIIADVSSGGRTERGVKLTLESGKRSDSVYLDVSEASQLQEELKGLDALHESACSGRGNCTFGIERCGPAQSMQQAYCPAVYHTRDGEIGLGMSTPRDSFRFPGMQALEVAAAIEVVVEELTTAEAGGERLVGE